MKNINSFYVVLLLTISFLAHADNGKESVEVQQKKVKLLNKYQIELHELKTKVVQLEMEVFLGGYHDLIERYQEIIKKLEYDIKQSKSYSYFDKKLQAQQSEIDDLKSSISSNNFFLFVSVLLSVMVATIRLNQ